MPKLMDIFSELLDEGRQMERALGAWEDHYDELKLHRRRGATYGRRCEALCDETRQRVLSASLTKTKHELKQAIESNRAIEAKASAYLEALRKYRMLLCENLTAKDAVRSNAHPRRESVTAIA